MSAENNSQIQEQLASLPLYVQDAFKAAQPFEKIRKIVTDFKLHIDEGRRLEQEILMVMVGLEAPDTFIDETSKTFGLTDEDTKKLIDRIISDLFMPIRESMQKYVEELVEKDEQQATATPTAPQTESAPVTHSVQVNASTPNTAPVRTPLSAPLPITTALPRVTAPQSTVQPASLQVQTVATPPSKPAPTQAPAFTSNPANIALSKPQSSAVEKITVGISPAKNAYKVDPYLEPPM